MKRHGFTLIELMVVIAIIIILAAIAIPNYLSMTRRANKSRIASDMATLATGLETFKTDWGSYPVVATPEAVSDPANSIYAELAGTGASPAIINVTTATNSVGEAGGIEYLKGATLTSILDPLKASPPDPTAYTDGHIYYASNGSGWALFAYTGDAGTPYVYRTDSISTVSAIGVPPNPSS